MSTWRSLLDFLPSHYVPIRLILWLDIPAFIQGIVRLKVNFCHHLLISCCSITIWHFCHSSELPFSV